MDDVVELFHHLLCLLIRAALQALHRHAIDFRSPHGIRIGIYAIRPL